MITDNIYNAGLDFAMEWGENFLQPIQGRLSKKFPELSKEELDECNKICQAVMSAGHNFVYKQLETAYDSGTKVNQTDLYENMKKDLLAHYKWINEENLNRLFSQGMYYSWKDGLHTALG